MHFKAREATVHNQFPLHHHAELALEVRRISMRDEIYNMITEVLQYNSTGATFTLFEIDTLLISAS